jgi:hypothetical protein
MKDKDVIREIIIWGGLGVVVASCILAAAIKFWEIVQRIAV